MGGVVSKSSSAVKELQGLLVVWVTTLKGLVPTSAVLIWRLHSFLLLGWMSRDARECGSDGAVAARCFPSVYGRRLQGAIVQSHAVSGMSMRKELGKPVPRCREGEEREITLDALAPCLRRSRNSGGIFARNVYVCLIGRLILIL